MSDKRHCLGFVLLREASWDSDGFFGRLEDKWGIRPEKVDSKEEKQIFVFGIGDMNISLAFIPAPVPNGEAEQNAAYNYLWREAVTETAKHTAQIVVSVSLGSDDLERALTFVKVCDSCIDSNTIGIYTNGVVYAPEFYTQTAQLINKGELPYVDLVWLGIAAGNGKMRGYTIGLENFGKHEVEILDCGDTPRSLLNMMLSVVSYVLDGNVTLHDGETIGFSAGQKLRITLSKGVEFDKDTLKIEYPSVKQ